MLDFGVAKLLDPLAGSDRTLTRAFPGPLRPNYVSPEQLRGLPVTTASDVYALGVLAYEIVTGVRPYETAGETLDRVMALVLETEPARPSAARVEDGAQPAYPLARLKGDLDAIVLKVMSKEPERRYGSAGEFASDLERYLTGEPVVAREPSMGYVLRRLALRHKAAVSIAAAALVGIVAALGAAVWQRGVAVKAQARAEQRSADTRQLANAIIFKIHDAIVPLAGSPPVRQMIVQEALAYLERLGKEAGGDESLQLELSRAYRQIGFIQGNPNTANLGNRDEALKHYEKARRLARPLALSSHAVPATISNLVNVDMLMADLVKRKDGVEAAAIYAQEAVEQARRLSDVTPGNAESRSLLGRALFGLALIYQPGPASIPLWQQALEHYEQDLAARPEDPQAQRNAALVCKYVSSVHEVAGRHELALPFHRRALELDERRHAADPTRRMTRFDLAVSLANVAAAAARADRDDEAAELYSRSLSIRQALSASDPMDVLSRSKVGYTQMRLAHVENQRRQFSRAEGLAAAAVAIHEELTRTMKDGSHRRDLGAALYILGRARRGLGRHAGTCELFARAAGQFQTTEASTYLREFADWADAEVQACRESAAPGSTR